MPELKLENTMVMNGVRFKRVALRGFATENGWIMVFQRMSIEGVPESWSVSCAAVARLSVDEARVFAGQLFQAAAFAEYLDTLAGEHP